MYYSNERQHERLMRRDEHASAHLVCTFVGALHTFYSMKRSRLDVLSFNNLTESSLSLLGYEPIFSHGANFSLLFSDSVSLLLDFY